MAMGLTFDQRFVLTHPNGSLGLTMHKDQKKKTFAQTEFVKVDTLRNWLKYKP